MNRCEEKMLGDLKSKVKEHIDEVKGDLTAEITRNILQQLEGAVIHSVPTNFNQEPNSSTSVTKQSGRGNHFKFTLLIDLLQIPLLILNKFKRIN